jgi:hypothetical protein
MDDYRGNGLRDEDNVAVGTLTTTVQDEIPQAGSLVEVRGQRWVVGEEPVPGRRGGTLLTLQSVEDGRYGESLPVIWEVEPGRLPRRGPLVRYGHRWRPSSRYR